MPPKRTRAKLLKAYKAANQRIATRTPRVNLTTAQHANQRFATVLQRGVPAKPRYAMTGGAIVGSTNCAPRLYRV